MWRVKGRSHLMLNKEKKIAKQTGAEVNKRFEEEQEEQKEHVDL